MTYSDNMKKIAALLLGLLVFSSCGAEEKEEPTVVEYLEVSLGSTYMADLTDVTGGPASGAAIMAISESGTYLTAAFEELPDPAEGYFYEGWLVRTQGELSVLSTGALKGDMNFFDSELDLSDHNQYVLTLEPDDGDPAPADHVVEGTFIQTE